MSLSLSMGLKLGARTRPPGGGVPGVPLPEGPLLGANLGNIPDPAEVAAYETYLGRPADMYNLHTGRADWSDYVTSIGFVGGRYSTIARERWWTIPLFITGGSLSAAAAGDYDGYWTDAAEAVLANAYSPSGAIMVRTGWEFNLSGQPWFSFGQEADYIAAFRRFVDCFRAVSNRFKFVWCPNFEVYYNPGSGNVLIDPMDSYPGDAYVDVFDMDFYVDLGNGSFASDPAAAYNYYFGGNAVTGRRINWLVAEAAAHGKPWGISEWGVGFDGYNSFMASAAAFFEANDALYTMYWESKSAYDGMLSDYHIPETAFAYQDNFGVAPFRLTSLASLARLYRSTYLDPVADGVAVATAYDESPNGLNATQGTGGNQPTKQTRNFRPTIRFDGSDDFLSFASTGLPSVTGVSTMVVLAYNSAPANATRQALSIGTASAGRLRSVGTSFTRSVWGSCNGGGNDHIAAESWAGALRLVVWELDPAATSGESTLYVNGGAGQTFNMTGTAIDTAVTSGFIGQRNGPADRWHGEISVGLAASAIYSTETRQKIEGAICWEHNCVHLLPSDHPCKNAPPAP